MDTGRKCILNLFTQLQGNQKHSVLKQLMGYKLSFQRKGFRYPLYISFPSSYEEVSSLQRCRLFISENVLIESIICLFPESGASMVQEQGNQNALVRVYQSRI